MANQDSKQIIYFGAPGTGKSYTIKKILEEFKVKKENIFRTTFHPDSDYSTFAGTYKPTMEGEKIIYKFVPQAFLNAYVQAYRNLQESRKNETEPEKVYLIIEEINRGNCAQVFGDLFQLLDRKEDGYSEYPIKADEDVKNFLVEEMDCDSDAIKDGELSLPPNLYIYATMNTSDQSLFPMDSAFKRRWDWEYIPIKYDNNDWKIVVDRTEYSNGCKIVVDRTEYPWVSFQKIVNHKIFEATGLEDKMLGDWFVKPENQEDENGNEVKVIAKEVFRDKILFYLWNDVCRDGDADIFKTGDSEEQKIYFSQLYDKDGWDKLKAMMKYLGVENYSLKDNNKGSEEEEDDDSEGSKTPGESINNSHLVVTYKGKVYEDKNSTKTFIEVINAIGPERVYELKQKHHNTKVPIIEKGEFERSGKIYDSGYYVTLNSDNKLKMEQLQEISNLLDLGLKVKVK